MDLDEWRRNLLRNHGVCFIKFIREGNSTWLCHAQESGIWFLFSVDSLPFLYFCSLTSVSYEKFQYGVDAHLWYFETRSSDPLWRSLEAVDSFAFLLPDLCNSKWVEGKQFVSTTWHRLFVPSSSSDSSTCRSSVAPLPYANFNQSYQSCSKN